MQNDALHPPTDHRGRRPRRWWERSAALALVVMVVTGTTLAAEPTPTKDSPPYRISPEDVLEISVWGEEDLQRQVVVRPDGGVSFPLAGNVQAAGKTTEELEAAITERLQTYIPDAVVTASVQELNGLRIYVSGNVESPGQYTVGRYVDVLQAITLAGGLTPFADAGDIRILRREDGREQVYHFNYRDVQRGRNLEQNILLQPDDVVMVP